MATPDRRRGIMLPIAVTILGLAAIGVVEEIPVRHSIEQKLTAASTAALAKAGVPVDGVNFTGRDGTIRVDSAADGNRALAVVRTVDGVRVVHVILTTGSNPPASTPTVAPSDSATPAPSVSLTVEPSEPAGPSTAPATAASSPTPSAPAASPSSPPTPTPSPSPTGPAGQTLAQVQAQLNALGDITFASGSTTLTSADKQIVARVAAVLAANPTVSIRVQGNTDSIGSAAANRAVSRTRAQVVANALHALGVATSRMTIVANGESKPLVPNDTPGTVA